MPAKDELSRSEELDQHKMKLGKRGTEFWPADKFIFWLMFGIVLGFSSIMFVLIISKSGAEKAKIYGNLESLNLMQRFSKSPDCFVYDKDGILAYGVIDYEKFNKERLDDCYKTSQYSLPAYKLTLSPDASSSKTLSTANWNENRNFEEKHQKNVIIFMQDKLHKGNFVIEIQNVR